MVKLAVCDLRPMPFLQEPRCHPTRITASKHPMRVYKVLNVMCIPCLWTLHFHFRTHAQAARQVKLVWCCNQEEHTPYSKKEALGTHFTTGASVLVS